MRFSRALPAALLALLPAITPALAQETPDLALETESDEPPTELQVNITNHVFCSHPTAKGDTVKVNYALKVFGSEDIIETTFEKKPFTFMVGLGHVIKGWDQGMMNMCPGERRTLTIPPYLAYGEKGSGDDIPENATLVFDTEMLTIYGHKQKSISTWSPVPVPTAINATVTQSNGSVFTTHETVMTVTATAPATPAWPILGAGALVPTGAVNSEDRVGTSPKDQAAAEENQCKLLGPFALLVQAALGVLALLTLVFKRFRETPKRPWKVWFFDVAKQVTGAVILHLINLMMSELGAGDLENTVADVGSKTQDEEGRKPNPCSFYLLNLAIDTTIGIPVLFVFLKVLHKIFLRTPLAKPMESISSGNYGSPPRWPWFFKQLLIYTIGLVCMKLFVWLLFALLPWLPWVGDWALRWTEGSEALQIAFVMFIFPLLMNILQYYIIDSFIKDSKRGQGYQEVRGDEADAEGDEERDRFVVDDDDDDSVAGTEDLQGRKKGEGMVETSPSPILVKSGEGSSGKGAGRKED
ncbi:hypothetical protein WHR41_07471 [Cladosporium halotolerans]|uniref:peptidylprolyl isomerase n=1 Tax=Cladosporium halotolerans TaxID=1052096 RepID=A0AB34KFB4_9PEZI